MNARFKMDRRLGGNILFTISASNQRKKPLVSSEVEGGRNGLLSELVPAALLDLLALRGRLSLVGEDRHLVDCVQLALLQAARQGSVPVHVHRWKGFDRDREYLFNDF